MEPQVTRHGVFDVQVCVPASFTDREAADFVNAAVLCGTTGGWRLRTDERLLCGAPVRRPCDERKGCVHIVFDA